MSFNMRGKKALLSQQKQRSTVSLPLSLKTELGLETIPKTTTSEETPRNANGIQDEEERRKARRDRANFFAQQRTSLNNKQSTKSKGGVIGRKEARKALRQEKKSSRSQNQKKPKQPVNDTRKIASPASRPITNGSKIITENNIDTSSKSKGKRKADDDSDRVASTSDRAPKSQKKHVKENTTTPLERLLKKQNGNNSEDGDFTKNDKRKNKRGASNLTQLEQQEDDEIAWLEANLGLRKSDGKKKKKSSTKGQVDEDDDILEDGLDDFIDDLDRFYPGMYDDNASKGTDDEDESEWNSEEEMSDDMDNLLEDFEGEDDESLSGTSEESEVGDSEYDDVNESESEEVEEKAKEGYVVSTKDNTPSGQTTTQEVANTQTPGKYIPPALRLKMEQSQSETISEEERKLQRAIKGLLNRFGENNLEIIIGEIEELYRQSSRAQVTNYLTKLVLETIALNENIGDTLVVLYAALITSLHRIVGVEFGAHFIQEMVDLLLKQYGIANASESNDTTETSSGKQAKNVIALMSSLYNLNVIACPLMYDIIRLLLGVEKDKKQTQSTMTELDVDLLLKVVKLCGAQLRHDDPTSLKSIISIAQEQQQKQIQNGQSASMRAKFMLESMSDLRNNRSRATTASVGAESLTKMRKFLGNLGKKHTIRTHEPLRVGLEDLRNVDKRGKWWLVGAAWAGYDFTSKEGSEKVIEKETKKSKKDKNDLDSLEAKEENIVQLSKQHGMNTAIRQQIFVTLLSSQDYLDAVHRLLTMTHKKATQRREIVRVLLHCLAKEPNFNPYYVVVGSRLANEDERGTRITMQYCLWDFMRKLGEKNVGGQSILSRQEEEEDDNDSEEDEDESTLAFGGDKGLATEQGMANVARTYGWWMAKGSLTLEAFRAVDFTTIKKGVPFVQLVIIHILLSISSTSPVHTLMASKGPSSQSDTSKKQKAVETLFVQGTRANQRLAQGLLIFMEQHLTSKKCKALAITKLGLSSEQVSSLLKFRMTALETVRVGARLAANDDLDMLE